MKNSEIFIQLTYEIKQINEFFPNFFRDDSFNIKYN